jgi:hypothetical protein
MKAGIAWGLLLTAVVSGILWQAWGREAMVAGAIFGLIATTIQAIAVAMVRPAFRAASSVFLGRWAVGMVLRIAGVALLGVCAYLNPAFFPPLPTAIGFLGVLVPLLFLEVRLIR